MTYNEAHKRLRNTLPGKKPGQGQKALKKKKKKIDTAVFSTAIVITMLMTAIPATGVVMAKDYQETQRDALADTISGAMQNLDATTTLNVDNFFEKIKFFRAPSVKGLLEKNATVQLSKDFDVKVKHKKKTYKELVEDSDTLFFGEVASQSQDMDEVTIEIIDPDMDDPLTAEMVNFGGRLAWPVPDSRTITSRFGGRASPGGIGSTNHKGLDIGAAMGSPIIAVKEGEVTHASSLGGYGNCVIIKHENGYETLYGHMSAITCNVGDKVKPGDIIGKVGSTGVSTGPHLHFSIIKDGVYVDPEPYLTGTNYIEPGEEVSENTEELIEEKTEETQEAKKEEDKKEKSATKKSSDEQKATENKGQAANDKKSSETKKAEETQKTTEKQTTAAPSSTEQGKKEEIPKEDPPATEPVTQPAQQENGNNGDTISED